MYEKITYYSRMSQTLHVPVPATVAGWTPSSLGSALKAWYKADTGVTKSGTDISGVADQSGNNFNLISTNTNPPQWNATGFNGFPAFATGGVTTLATDSGNPNGVFTGFGTDKLASVFVAATLANAGVANGRLVVFGYSTDDDFGTTTSSMLLCRDGSNQGIGTFRNGVEVTSEAISGYDTPLRLGMIYDGNNVTPYVNNIAGTAVANGDAFATPGTLVIGNSYLGGSMATQSNAWVGYCAEIIVANTALDSTTRDSLDTYLKGRFGL